MEVAMIVGLMALGYSLVSNPHPIQAESAPKQPMETFINPAPFEPDTVDVKEDTLSHNNMVPFFGSKVTQSSYSGATDGILDTYTGSGAHTFKRKEEQTAMFKPEAGTGNPFGLAVETDFEQSRQVTSMSMKNVAPIERIQVGPGLNDGYTNLPSGGYQQDTMREYALPRTTDEIRTANKPKVSYGSQVIPGSHYITEMGIQAPVKKNRPDRFQVLTGKDGSLERVNTSVGQQVMGSLYPDQMMKEQQRESTSSEQTGPGMAAAGGYLSYVRALSEPFQQFMRLTVEGRGGPGAVQGTALHQGPNSVNVKIDKDESVLVNVRGFEAPLMTQGGEAPNQHVIGSVKQYVPLEERNRNEGSILDSLKTNPFNQSVTNHY